jgi:hypothetical protein
LLAKFFDFQNQHFVAIHASRLDQLKPFQDIKTSLRVLLLFSMIANSLTDRNQSISIHSPFPALACFDDKITLVEVSSIDLPTFFMFVASVSCAKFPQLFCLG